MKSVKILSLLVVALVIGTTTINAQSSEKNLSEDQREELAQNLEEYFAALDLTEEQQPKFEEITRRYAGQMKEVKGGSERKLQKYKKIKSIREKKNAEMKDLLTKDQYKVYLDKQEEMQQKMKERRGK